MADESNRKDTELFFHLVQQYQMGAMIHLGKIVHPETRDTERNLEAAKLMIDFLGMIESKTRGNLVDEEERFLRQVITNLKLNYVDEANRKEETPADEQEEKSAPEEAVGGNDPGAA